MLKKIIGRKKEIKVLDRIWGSNEAEFLAIYGRRRVGKTHLIREYFCEKEIYLELTGIKDAPLANQLANFASSFSKTFYPDIEVNSPSSWQKAFEMLTNELEKTPRNKKIVLFFDELPWLSSRKSGFIQALDYFWNTRWSRFNNLKLIVCGSAASWMLDHLINAKGGLHNRITQQIPLEPFSLNETKEFLQSRNIKCTNKLILDIYMALGGIPHYLKQIQKGKSAIQNINDICFNKDGLLYGEFPRLIKSLFKESSLDERILRNIAKNRNGISRNELLKKIGKPSGGRFGKRLEELEAAGFVQGFTPYGKKKKDRFYRIIDEYTLFYIDWIEPFVEKGKAFANESYWENKLGTPGWRAWAGFAFEGICYNHTAQIRKALKLDKISCETGAWRYIPRKGSKEKGAQIDLLFDRDDDVISICEIKYSKNKFGIDKTYSKNLINKIETFEKHFSSSKHHSLVMITTMGIKRNVWSEDLVEAEVNLEDLFKP